MTVEMISKAKAALFLAKPSFIPTAISIIVDNPLLRLGDFAGLYTLFLVFGVRLLTMTSSPD